MRSLLNKVKLYFFKKKWRKANAHNFTIAANVFPFEKVKVGKFTYGHLDVQTWGSENEKLIIGQCCSIAWTSKFILGGNHLYNGFFTYPFGARILKTQNEAISKGPIVIEDDVWIGMNAIILSGVTIGKGAIIGTGAVVSTNIPGYAIVVGNPATIIKYRFPEEIRERLLIEDFSRFNYENINEGNVGVLSSKITEIGDVEKVINVLTGNTSK